MQAYLILIFIIVHSVASSYLIPSLFDSFPPYINFPILNNCQRIPGEIKKFLYWPKEYDSTTRIVQTSMRCAGINLLNRNQTGHCDIFIEKDKVLGSYISKCSNRFRKIYKDFMKRRGLPRIHIIDDKDKLGNLLNGLKRRHPRINFPFILPSFNLPRQFEKFKHEWSKMEDKLWISKPPLGIHSRGVKLISHWNQASNKTDRRTIQKYVSKPWLFNGRKIELRTLVLVTSFKPLRIYTFPKLFRFKQQTVNYTLDEKSYSNRCVHIRSRFGKCEFAKGKEFNDPILSNIFNEMERNGGSTAQIFDKVNSAIIVTFIEWENKIAQNYEPRYGSYQLLSFDWIIDENFNPFLNEINYNPGILGRYIRFYKYLPEMFKIIGINFPPSLSPNAKKQLRKKLDMIKGVNTKSRQTPLVYNSFNKYKLRREDLVSSNLYTIDAPIHTNSSSNEFLKKLTMSDVILLGIIEDELNRVTHARRIFPSDKINQYIPLINSNHRFYYQLLDEWENSFKDQRKNGRNQLNEILKINFKLRAH